MKNVEKIDFLAEAKKFEKNMIELRRGFHKNPELGFEEIITSQVIEQILQKSHQNAHDKRLQDLAGGSCQKVHGDMAW